MAQRLLVDALLAGDTKAYTELMDKRGLLSSECAMSSVAWFCDGTTPASATAAGSVLVQHVALGAEQLFSVCREYQQYHRNKFAAWVGGHTLATIAQGGGRQGHAWGSALRPARGAARRRPTCLHAHPTHIHIHVG